MSGIVGIVNLDGAPVSRLLLKEMTDHLAFRGPDAQNMWIEGEVGFGHTMLRTTWESEGEHQPFSLDGQVWITADARVDDRENLVEKLASKGQEVVSAADLMLNSSCAHTTPGENTALSICSATLHSRSGTDIFNVSFALAITLG